MVLIGFEREPDFVSRLSFELDFISGCRDGFGWSCSHLVMVGVVLEFQWVAGGGWGHGARAPCPFRC